MIHSDTQKHNLLTLQLFIAVHQDDLREEYLGTKERNVNLNLAGLIAEARILHSLIYLDREEQIRKVDRMRFGLI